MITGIRSHFIFSQERIPISEQIGRIALIVFSLLASLVLFTSLLFRKKRIYAPLPLYRNNLKNREYAKEAPSIYASLNGAEAAKLNKFSAGAPEDASSLGWGAGWRKLSGCPTPAETDSSDYFGINPAPAPIALLESAPPPPQQLVTAQMALLTPICKKEEKAIVVEIFTTIATAGVLDLKRKESHLKALGQKIAEIHPFAFLLAAPKDKVQQVFKRWIPMIKANTMEGIVSGMIREFRKNNLLPYVDSFAAKMKKEAKIIEQRIQSQNWQGLVDYLYDIDV